MLRRLLCSAYYGASFAPVSCIWRLRSCPENKRFLSSSSFASNTSKPNKIMPAKEEKKRPTSKAEKNKPKTKEELKAKKAANAAKKAEKAGGGSAMVGKK